MAPTKGRTQKGEGKPQKAPRKPPQFIHLPAQRAMKLKREWVQRQKIKSAYHSELRKTGRQALSLPEDEVPPNEEKDSGEGNRNGLESSQNIHEPPSPPRKLGKRGQGPQSNPSEQYPTSPKSPPQCPQPGLSKEDRDRVRELTREAYSRTSLHTFKSDPLYQRPRSGRGPSNRGHERGEMRGKGQPNMRKRMGALLEQIKLKS